MHSTIIQTNLSPTGTGSISGKRSFIQTCILFALFSFFINPISANGIDVIQHDSWAPLIYSVSVCVVIMTISFVVFLSFMIYMINSSRLFLHSKVNEYGATVLWWQKVSICLTGFNTLLSGVRLFTSLFGGAFTGNSISFCHEGKTTRKLQQDYPLSWMSGLLALGAIFMYLFKGSVSKPMKEAIFAFSGMEKAWNFVSRASAQACDYYDKGHIPKCTCFVCTELAIAKDAVDEMVPDVTPFETKEPSKGGPLKRVNNALVGGTFIERAQYYYNHFDDKAICPVCKISTHINQVLAKQCYDNWVVTKTAEIKVRAEAAQIIGSKADNVVIVEPSPKPVFPVSNKGVYSDDDSEDDTDDEVEIVCKEGSSSSTVFDKHAKEVFAAITTQETIVPSVIEVELVKQDAASTWFKYSPGRWIGKWFLSFHPKVAIISDPNKGIIYKPLTVPLSTTETWYNSTNWWKYSSTNVYNRSATFYANNAKYIAPCIDFAIVAVLICATAYAGNKVKNVYCQRRQERQIDQLLNSPPIGKSIHTLPENSFVGDIPRVLKPECIHYKNCPEQLPCKANEICNHKCTGQQCTHFANCKGDNSAPTKVKTWFSQIFNNESAERIVARKKAFDVYNYDSNSVVMIGDEQVKCGTKAFHDYMSGLVSISRPKAIVHVQAADGKDVAMRIQFRHEAPPRDLRTRKFNTMYRKGVDRLSSKVPKCTICQETHRSKKCKLHLADIKKIQMAHQSFRVAFTPEALLGVRDRLNLDRIHNRMFKLVVNTTEFVCNGFLFGNMIVTTKHGLIGETLIAAVSHVQNYTVVGDKLMDLDDDLVGYRIQGLSAEKMEFAIPKDGEPVFLVAFDDLGTRLPKISSGVINNKGFHSCPSVNGNCGGVLVNHDNKIVAIHNAGSTQINKAIPMTVALIAKLSQGFQ